MGAYQDRMRGSAVNHRHALLKMRKNTVRDEISVGRSWTPFYAMNPKFPDSDEWGSVSLGLQPVFAGLASESLERSAVQALANLPYAFCRASQADFTARGRHALVQLVDRPLNAVRFLWRLASMYLAAIILEAEGRHLTVNSTAGLEQPRSITSVTDLVAVLTHAMERTEQVAFIDVGKHLGGVQPIIQVITLATAPVVGWRDTDGPLPAVLKMWPEINNLRASVYGEMVGNVEVGEVNSGNIWETISLYARQHGLQDVWEEVWTAALTFYSRPEGSKGWCGHTNVVIPMPVSRMEVAALGPLSHPMRSWDYTSAALKHPHMAEAAWEGNCRYAGIALGVGSTLESEGANMLSYGVYTAEEFNYFERLHANEGTACPLNVGACNLMGDLGWSNLTGRALLGVRGYNAATPRGRLSLGGQDRSPPPSAVYVTLMDESAIQWEEFAYACDSIPHTAAIYAQLHPVGIKDPAVLNWWIRTDHIENRTGTADAIYSLLNTTRCQYSLCITAMPNRTCTYRALAPRTGYRGVYLDHQFSEVASDVGVMAYPCFRFTNHTDVVNSMEVSKLEAGTKWYISTAKDVTFDGVIAEYGYPPPPAKMQPGEAVGAEFGPAGGACGGDDGRPFSAEDDKAAGADMAASIQAEIEAQAKAEAEAEARRVREVPARAPRSEPKGPAQAKLLRFKTLQSKLYETAGTVPPWVETLEKLKMLGDDNPIEANRKQITLTQQMLDEVRRTDNLGYLAIVPMSERPAAAKAIAGLFREASAFCQVGSSTTDLYGMGIALDQVAANMATNPFLSADDIRSETGKELPAGVTAEHFHKAVSLGLHPATIINAKDATQLDKLIADQQAAIDDAVGNIMSGKAAPQPQEAHSAGPVEGAVTKVAPLPSTPEVTVEIEPHPAGTDSKPSDFGGAQPSPAAGVSVPASQASASSAAGTSRAPATATFSGQKLD
jgi:hypothetical protein